MVSYYRLRMSVQLQEQTMVNPDYRPSEKDEQVLEVLKDGRNSGEPWGRANPRYLVDKTGLSKSNVEFCLRSLKDAGWIRRISRGLYEFAEDPREDGDRE